MVNVSCFILKWVFRGKIWLISMRLPTLSASICPVLIGSLIANAYCLFSWSIFLFCLLFAVCLHIGTNWINDYYDYIQGVDIINVRKVQRLLPLNVIAAPAMRNAAIGAFCLAFVCSLPLVVRLGWLYIFPVFLCIGSGVWYSKGKYALAYLGLGDLFVMIFFGFTAVCGSSLAQLHFIPIDAVIASLIPGSLSCAILCANNLRDIDEDRQAGKRTLVVRFGARFGQIQYTTCLFLAWVVPLWSAWRETSFFPLTTWFTLLLAVQPLRVVWREPKLLDKAVRLTAVLLMFYCIAFCVNVNLVKNRDRWKASCFSRAPYARATHEPPPAQESVKKQACDPQNREILDFPVRGAVRNRAPTSSRP
jgi:1,4-dihydroxy-2-naphthoate octaprenyltransferase